MAASSAKAICRARPSPVPVRVVRATIDVVDRMPIQFEGTRSSTSALTRAARATMPFAGAVIVRR